MTRLERELAQERAARSLAEEASRQKDQFIAALSHELRAPIAAMLLWEKVLRDETANGALHAQALDAIHRSAVAQSRLVGDLLDVSRAITGKLHVDLRPLDIERVLHEALAAIAPAALAKRIDVRRRGAPLAIDVQADDARLHQVLDNLLANAVKFTDAGGRVDVAVSSDECSISIEITDSGCGIAPEFLPRLFDPFSQIDDSLSRESGGLGLGLAIAKQLIALHDGTIAATSAGLGEGASFVVTLPIAQRHREPAAVGAPHAPRLDRVRVLVIDDDHRVRDALALLLERAGALVETAASAEMAREQITRHVPEALVCDIAMPGEDGYSFIRRLREADCWIPAIAVTAHARENDAQQAVTAGFDLHLAKPIDFERLVRDIDTLVGVARPQRRANT